jgi:NhaA family Na+:H+ antiporter
MVRILKDFLALEAASGLVLMAVAAFAMLVANSPLATYYETIFSHHSPASLIINDGLMVIFFFLIGLEIKREILQGELSTRSKALLPVIAAAGGVIVPALIYSYFNMGSYAAKGWAIPAATDIAFSLGVLSLFGSRIPTSLKIFLMALAVIDDLIAIIIIAIFYTASLNLPALAAACGCIVALWLLTKRNNATLFPMLLVGVLLWLAILMSGVHATIAGVILGLMLPMRHNHMLIKRLHSPVAYGIIPIFAFANAGLSLSNISIEAITQPISLGIILGLVIGKPLGIFTTCYVLIICKKAALPSGSSYMQLLSVSLIAGIGFTMSLFIAALTSSQPEFSQQARLGIIVGSLCSGVLGAFLLKLACKFRH